MGKVLPWFSSQRALQAALSAIRPPVNAAASGYLATPDVSYLILVSEFPDWGIFQDLAAIANIWCSATQPSPAVLPGCFTADSRRAIYACYRPLIEPL